MNTDKIEAAISKLGSFMKICEKPGCDKEVFAKDNCQRHYNRDYYIKTRMPKQETRWREARRALPVDDRILDRVIAAIRRILAEEFKKG